MRKVILAVIFILTGHFCTLEHFGPSRALAQSARAESDDMAEAARGRLPDGRAFRTDAEGNQLVDYIAELEVNIETLSRQVKGLEEETQAKQAQIERLSSNAMGETQPLARREGVAIAERSIVGERCPACPEDGGQDNEAVSRITTLLEEARSDLEIERQLAAQRLSKAEERAQQLSMELKAKSIETERLRTELLSLNEAVTNSRTELQRRQEAQDELVRQTNKLREEIESKEKQLASSAMGERLAGSVSSLEDTARASLSPVKASESRNRALEVVRGRTLTELNQLRSLLATRDEMYKKYAAEPRTVRFKPSKAQSSEGNGIVELQKLVQKAQSFQELSNLSKQVSSIGSKLSDDIALMKRVGRL